MISRDEIAPYSPQSNGFAESTNLQLKFRAKCLLLPTDTINDSTLYEYAIVDAAYLLNRRVNIHKGKTVLELLVNLVPTMKNIIRFGADVVVNCHWESIIKSRSNIEVDCGTFLGTAKDSNCRRVWLKGDSKNARPVNYQHQAAEVAQLLDTQFEGVCVAQKDPRANFVDEPGSTTGSGSSVFSSKW